MTRVLLDPVRPAMRPLKFAGLVLIGLATIVLLHGGSFVSPQHLLMMGNLTPPAGQLQRIPGWFCGLGILAGGVQVMAGARRRD